MKKNKILCIGEILWDRFPEGDFLGGAPFNTACHLHMMGQNVNIASRVGKDPAGKKVLVSLRKKGISSKYVQCDDKINTGIVNIVLHENGVPSFEIVSPAAWDFIEKNADLEELASGSDVMVFGTLAQRNYVSRETIGSLRKKIPLKVFDINLRPPYDDKEIVWHSLLNTQVVKLNDQEALKLSSWYGYPPDFEKLAKSIASAFGTKTICITMGSEGAGLWHNERWTLHPGYKVSVKDTVGSGDAFLASMLSDILHGLNNEEILRNANAMGAYVASQNGAAPELNFDEIRRIRS